MGRRDGTGGGRRRGLLERFLFSFMGPPEIGDLTSPPRAPTGPVARCSRCSRSYDDHEIVRDPGLTYTRCPPA